MSSQPSASEYNTAKNLPLAPTNHSESKPVSGPITRSQDFWFEDGSMIIQAESMQFRVYRGLLERHSTIFNDMFQVPQPAEESMVDGCPVVVVSDRAKDWENLLSLLFMW